MKKSLLFITLLDILFLFFFILSATVALYLSEIFYYLAFIIPLFHGFVYLGTVSKEGRRLRLGIDSGSFAFSLPFVAPTVGAVFLISALTSLLLSLFGFFDTPPDLSGTIVTVLFVSAVLPAVLEEFLFRYIPINLLGEGSPKLAVLFSAGMFALVHCNIFQLPYAFVAGVIFALVDIGFGSIVPSVMIHLLNNTVSVFWLRSGGENALIFAAVMAFVSVISLALIYIMRKKYKIFFAEMFYGKG